MKGQSRTLILLQSHVESADHNMSVFVWRIHSIVICIVAKCRSFYKKNEIINKNVEKHGAKDSLEAFLLKFYAIC